MAKILSKIKFPRIHQIKLTNFSLYSSSPVISIKIPDGVFCLTGANGLGKSTLLSAIHFGLTGIVPHSGEKFLSVEEYYSDNLDFSRNFFNGRITEDDHDLADISLSITIGNFKYELTRGMFEPKELRYLKIEDSLEKENIFDSESSKMSPEMVHNEYVKNIVLHTGLESFSQMVFLYSFIFTFDERRHLLFWDQKVCEQALHLAFGIDPAEAQRADLLRREMERAGSLARNANWDATQVRNQINDLKRNINETLKGEDPRDIRQKYDKLIEEEENKDREVERIELEVKDAMLKLSELSAKEANLRVSYNDEFNNKLKKQYRLKLHPLIVSSRNDGKCGLCGSTGEKSVKEILDLENATSCPICKSVIAETKEDPKIIEKLKKTDEDLVKTRKESEMVLKTIARLNSELDKAKAEANKAREKINEFENANKKALSDLNKKRSSGEDIDAVLEKYRLQMEEYLEKKRKYYEKRDEKQKALNRVQKELEKQYFSAEGSFVPLFKDLAFEFLGLDLDVKLALKGSGINLTLEVKGKARRQYHQLSESQRFFVDIALRMALAQYISDSDSKASLFIDTPEGSLDVAYESRAGDMFAKFIMKGFDILMTANINSSRMIRTLAEKCGKKKMEICRMTSWAELSEVQVAEEKLFEQVYAEIEKALNSKGK